MFKLEIETGNEAMRTYEDIAAAMDATREQIEAGEQSGILCDVNGNTVGSYEFTVPCAAGCGVILNPDELIENATDYCPDCDAQLNRD